MATASDTAEAPESTLLARLRAVEHAVALMAGSGTHRPSQGDTVILSGQRYVIDWVGDATGSLDGTGRLTLGVTPVEGP